MDLEDLYRLLRAGHIQAQGIVDTLEEPLLVLDKTLCVQSGNRAFFETFRVSKDETLGRPIFELGNGQWDIPELRKLLSEVVPKSTAVVGYEVNHGFPGLGRKTVLVSARRLVHPDSSNSSILILFEDVTERRRIDAEKDIVLAETRHRMKNLLATVRAIANRTVADGRSGCGVSRRLPRALRSLDGRTGCGDVGPFDRRLRRHRRQTGQACALHRRPGGPGALGQAGGVTSPAAQPCPA